MSSQTRTKYGGRSAKRSRSVRRGRSAKRSRSVRRGRGRSARRSQMGGCPDNSKGGFLGFGCKLDCSNCQNN